MSALLARLREHFVAPPSTAPHGWRPAPPAPARPPALAVLSAPGDVAALGAGLGLALVRGRRPACVAVCVWTGEAEPGLAWHAPALPASRRLVAGLAARGHDARAAGRLALVRLPADDAEAAAAAARVVAAAGTAPTVLALGGPRTPTFDELLAAQDLVVVATRGGADPALARLAVAGLAAQAVPACACEVPAAPPARALAAAGIALLPSARRAFAEPVEALA